MEQQLSLVIGLKVFSILNFLMNFTMQKVNYKWLLEILKNSIFISVFLMLFVFINNLNAQSQLFISIDRGIYIAGENVKVNTGINKYSCQQPLYIYCELMGQNGQRFSGVKIKLDSPVRKFDFHLDDNLKSGYYYLRSYFYKQNLSVGAIDYAFFKLVNPASKEVLDFSNESKKIYIDTLLKANSNIEIKTNKLSYATREFVDLKVNVDTNLINPLFSTVSVVPKNSFLSFNLSEKTKLSFVNNMCDNKRSLILKGTISNKKTGSPLDNKRIYISVINSNDVMSTLSDSLGRWYVQLPDYYGLHEIIISPEENNEDFNIEVNKEFLSDVSLKFQNIFVLDSVEQKVALDLAANYVVAGAFKRKHKTRSPVIENKVFYNKADQVIRIMDYVDLPKLSMYFTELPGFAHLTKSRGNYEIRILDKSGLILLHKPLLMVDNVPISDLNYILDINPKFVNRIEIVNADYQKGDAIFGGILNFITNKKDFGGLNFPETSVSINYQFLHNYFYNEESVSLYSNEPDARNTLAFFNDLSMKNELHFYTGDVLGEYYIIVQTINKDGEKVSYYSSFDVQAK